MRKYTVSFTETIEAEDESAAYDAMLDRMADDVKNGDVTCYDFTEIMDTPPETPAACMIAAAPAMLAALEMLAALKDAEFLLRKAGLMAGPMRDSFNRSAGDAREAIAKAEGNA